MNHYAAVIVATIDALAFLVLMFVCAQHDLNTLAGACLLLATIFAFYARGEYVRVRRERELMRRPPFTTTD